MLASRILVVAALIGGLGAVGACGSDADSDSDSAALTKEELIQQGDALCRDFMEFSDALGDPTSVEELVALLDDAIAEAERTRDAFEALDPPADGEAVHAALVSAIGDSIPKVREAREKAADGDPVAASAAMDEATTIGATSDDAAKAYGFQVCGSEAELRAAE